jgi:hypothetical protein
VQPPVGGGDVVVVVVAFAMVVVVAFAKVVVVLTARATVVLGRAAFFCKRTVVAGAAVDPPQAASATDKNPRTQVIFFIV